MNRTDQLMLIRESFSNIPDLYDGFKNVRDYLFGLNADAERRHRKGAPYGAKHGLSVADAARLFTVSHLLDGWKQPDKWSVEHIIQIRIECLYAQAYAKKHHAELAEWAGKYAEPFAAVDYAELMA